MRNVSSTGSMLSCKTPILNGTFATRFCLLSPRRLRVRPGLLEPLDHGPQGFIQRRGDADLLAPLDNGTVHEVHFGRTPRLDVLKHTGLVLPRRPRPRPDHLAGIVVERDAHGPRHSDTLFDEGVEECAGRL